MKRLAHLRTMRRCRPTWRATEERVCPRERSTRTASATSRRRPWTITNNLILSTDQVVPVELQELVCVRQAHLPMFKPYNFTGLEAAYTGASLVDGRCPHRGTPLLSQPLRNGRRICPSHGLCFDAAGRQCPRHKKP